VFFSFKDGAFDVKEDLVLEEELKIATSCSGDFLIEEIDNKVI
jgi:hypothetical protein